MAVLKPIVEFFAPTDPLDAETNFAGWSFVTGANPNTQQQRAGSLGGDGDEICHAMHDGKESITCTYQPSALVGDVSNVGLNSGTTQTYLTLPNFGDIFEDYHIDSVSLAYSQNDIPKLTVNAHKHVQGNTDSNCRKYAPTIKLQLKGIGCPVKIVSETGNTTIFQLGTGTGLAVRSLVYTLTGNHIEEHDSENGHLAADNHDGNETMAIELTGNIPVTITNGIITSSAVTVHPSWQCENIGKNQGNTTATTSSLNLTHHIAGAYPTST